MTHLITVEIDQMSKGEAAAWIKSIANMFGTDFVHECAEDREAQYGTECAEGIDPEYGPGDVYSGGKQFAPSPHWYDAAGVAAGIARLGQAVHPNETVTGAEMLRAGRARLARELGYRA